MALLGAVWGRCPGEWPRPRSVCGVTTEEHDVWIVQADIPAHAWLAENASRAQPSGLAPLVCAAVTGHALSLTRAAADGDGRPQTFQQFLRPVGPLARDLVHDQPGGVVDEILCFFQPHSGQGADRVDDEDLPAAWRDKYQVAIRVDPVLGKLAVRGTRGHGRRQSSLAPAGHGGTQRPDLHRLEVSASNSRRQAHVRRHRNLVREPGITPALGHRRPDHSAAPTANPWSWANSGWRSGR